MKGFIEFIRERAVVGFAVGFILGGAVTQVISSLVHDIINPVVGLLLSGTKGIESMYFQVSGARIMWGHFISIFLNFLILAAVVYFIVKGFKLENHDKKK